MPTEAPTIPAPRRKTLTEHVGISCQVHEAVKTAALARAEREGITLAQSLREGLTHLYNIGWFEMGEGATE